MINKFKTSFLFLFVWSISLFAQQESKDVRKGNRAYEDKNYVKAEVDYRRGLSKNNKGFEANFN
ncbi:MAG: aerotolerance regulator BatC, partial [Paludibacteraceae bacterium]|nr:aerotolerance regulator BatC [Paludibacteraceae bacterium]